MKFILKYATCQDLDAFIILPQQTFGDSAITTCASVSTPQGPKRRKVAGPDGEEVSMDSLMPRGWHRHRKNDKKDFHIVSERLKLRIGDFSDMTFHDFSTWHLLHYDARSVRSLANASVLVWYTCLRSSTLGTTSTSSRLVRNPESCEVAWCIRETALCAPLNVACRTLIVIGTKNKFRIACGKSSVLLTFVCCFASGHCEPKPFLATRWSATVYARLAIPQGSRQRNHVYYCICIGGSKFMSRT